jgi:hypothetical protein
MVSFNTNLFSVAFSETNGAFTFGTSKKGFGLIPVAYFSTAFFPAFKAFRTRTRQ